MKKKDYEQTRKEKIEKNIEDIIETLEMIVETIDSSYNLNERKDFIKKLNTIKDHVWYLQDNYFYTINNN